GSIGSGVYYYDGRSFQNFTTKDGLPNDEIGCIYEDKIGNIWFGANGGASRYDGKSFRNFMINGDSIEEDRTGKSFPNFTRPPKEVTSIMEDKTGKFWFATRGNTFIYDPRLADGQRKTFTTVIHDGKPFRNVRCLIEDKKGNIWLGGSDGLWRYDGSTFINFAQNFVGHIYEDKKGNIWTSAEESPHGIWALFCYDQKTLSDKKPTASVIKSNEGMIFGILEAFDGSIWFGALKGVYRYDGTTITDFKAK
ncbi:MAG: ligand-binding sensor domain-containing protein, partial [Bacteroidota bacterium]